MLDRCISSRLAMQLLRTSLLPLMVTSTLALCQHAHAQEAPASVRFAEADIAEIPNFQRHVTPLLGRLGCNGRACHGSFQGRGDFRLSLFGYDFKADHEALMAENTGRVDLDDVQESLVLAKPIDADLHEGGKRMEKGSWQYNVLKKWIAGGAKFSAGDIEQLEELEVTPSEIRFNDANEQIDLRVVAHWADGSSEDVTELCRYSSNDDAIASISESGHVTGGETGDTHVVVYYDNAVVPIAVLRPIAEPRIAETTAGTRSIDAAIEQKISKLGIVASPVCSDEDFVRRVSLDVTGTLPSPMEVREFLANPSPDKRERYVDALLERPTYAAWWATRLSDWTGNNEAEMNNVLPARNVASKLWYEWLRERIAKNVPYDKIVEGIVIAKSRDENEDYQSYCDSMSQACRPGGEKEFAQREGMPLYWSRRNFRLPEERAIGFAYTFLGVRIECAQCHKHPFDQWSKDDFDAFSKLFTPIKVNPGAVAKENQDDRDRMLTSLGVNSSMKGNLLRKKLAESVIEGKTVPFGELVVDTAGSLQRAKSQAAQAKKKGKKVDLRIPTGKILGESSDVQLSQDPRVALMSWLRSPDNPYFAKAVVNRVWSNYFGVGIVNPTDDMNLANPPSNAALLDYLATELISHDFDLKWLHREITSSDAYQRSAVANDTNRLDQRNFSRHIPRRYPSEIVHDAVLLATMTDANANSTRDSLEGMAITDALSIYGSAKNSTFALDVFGRSQRESNCDCDRSDAPSLLQSVYLRNDIDIHRRLADRQGWVESTCRQLGFDSTANANEKVEDSNRIQSERLIELVETRLADYNRLPERRQKQMKPKMAAQFEKISNQLGELGVSLPPLAKLLKNPSLIKQQEAAAETSVSESATGVSLENLVEDAYLRTLSRYPTTDEIETSVTFIQESSSKGNAVQSLLWALLNTKEFIISH